MFFSKPSVRSRFLAVTCVVVAAIPALAALAAMEGTISVQGSRQGTFKSAHVLEVHTSIVSSRDPQSKMDTGRRQHQPIVIVKEIDADSSRYMKALTSNELLTQVVIEFKGPQGKSPRTLKLVDALITEIKRVPRAGGTGENEEISFTYREIEWTYVNGSKSAQDSWDAK
jgi:type VI secretion system secreted protein Hcp